jgi:hypothetical protein
MSRLAGYGGDVYIGAVQVAGIREWSIDDVANTQDSSGFDTGQDKAFTPTQKEWSGSFNGFKDGAPLAKGSEVAAEFRESSIQKWTGNIIITGRSPGSTVDGLVTYNYTFQGTGALTEPTT